MTLESPDPPLYGLGDAEHLHDDPETVIQQMVDSEWEPRLFDIEVVVWEWSATGMGKFLPAAPDLLERIAEWVCDEDEMAFEEALEAIHEAVVDPDVVRAFEDALNVLHENLQPRFRFADRQIGTVTFIVRPDNTFERKEVTS